MPTSGLIFSPLKTTRSRWFANNYKSLGKLFEPYVGRLPLDEGYRGCWIHRASRLISRCVTVDAKTPTQLMANSSMT
jgi:hypothetical protein